LYSSWRRVLSLSKCPRTLKVILNFKYSLLFTAYVNETILQYSIRKKRESFLENGAFHRIYITPVLDVRFDSFFLLCVHIKGGHARKVALMSFSQPNKKN